MKALRHYYSLYLRSWWLAPVIPLLSLSLGLTCAFFEPRRLSLITNAFAVLFLLGLLGLLGSTLWNLFKKQWLRGILHFLTIPVGLALAIGGSFILMFADKDDFAGNLTIPTNIEVALPLSERPHEPGSAIDLFQKSLL
jgi:energy-coupling factor transporter transmembrane protein EcfT